MNAMSVEDLFGALQGMNAFELADAVFRTCTSEGAPIAPVALEWAKRCAEAPLPTSAPQAEASVVRLLQSLPDSGERYLGILRAIGGGLANAHDTSAAIRLAVRLAPHRNAEEQWPIHVAAYAKQETDAGNGLSAAAQLLAEVDARLAYSLLFAQLGVLGMEPPSDKAPLPEMLRGFLFRDPVAEAAEALLAIAIARIGSEAPLPADAELLAVLTEDAVLGSRMLTIIAAGVLREGKAVPAALRGAMDRARDRKPSSQWGNALFLLANSECREEVPRLIAQMLQSSEAPQHRQDVLSVLDEVPAGMFSGPGWGREKAGRRLVPLTRAFLKLGLWNRWFWARVLGDPIGMGRRSAQLRKERGDDWVDRRSLEFMTQGLLAIATDATEPMETRRRAVDAIGLAGVGEVAKSLGAVKDEELKQDVRSARQRLSRAGKGHPVPPDLGLRFALEAFYRGKP
ncbi:MAG: hypothetical protein NDI82_02685 [Anaeromyxobacteraceae bacterium]|nr:hypothetical protein [Anaeromyxobacteraceae bacterium]